MTGYEALSQVQLYSLFSSNTWKQLSLEQKVNACQEIENRYANENGVAPCTVDHEPMNGSTFGYQYGGQIVLNNSLLREGVFETTYTDTHGITQIAKISVPAPNWNTLDTIFHEGTHGIQEATGRMPHTYISPESDQDLYRIQAIEKEAYAVGQSRTLDAISEVEHNSGMLDSERHDYIEYVKMDSFAGALLDSQIHYNDPDIEQTLNTVIEDRDSGMLQIDYSNSYSAIYTLCDNQYDHFRTKDISIEHISANEIAYDGAPSQDFSLQTSNNTAYDGMNSELEESQGNNTKSQEISSKYEYQF